MCYDGLMLSVPMITDLYRTHPTAGKHALLAFSSKNDTQWTNGWFGDVAPLH